MAASSAREPLLEPARALPVAGAEGGEHLGGERSGEAGHGEDAPVAAQLQGGIQERARTDKDRPLRGRVAVCGEVLRIARRVLDADDVGVRRQLPQQAGRDCEVCVLGDVVDEHGHRARVRHGTIVISEARGRNSRGEVRGRSHEDGVRSLGRGRPSQGHGLPGGLPTRARDEPALVRQHLPHPCDHAALLLRIEQGRLPRRPPDDHTVEPRRDESSHVVAQVDGSDLPRRAVERRGDGGQHPRELPLGHWPGVASAGVAVRARRRTERSCFSNSAGFVVAARAGSYVTTSSATRSIRC